MRAVHFPRDVRSSVVDLDMRWEGMNSQGVRVGFIYDDRFRFERPLRAGHIRQRKSRANGWIGSNKDYGFVLPVGFR